MASTSLHSPAAARRLLLIFLLAGLANLTAPSVVAAADTPRRPNIVWIMFDDLGYADPGCYGGEVIPTPNMDQLASEGTRFTSAYCGNPQCAPSRNVLMTGQHTGRTKLRSNFADKNGIVGQENGFRGFIDETDTTVAEVLHQAGYATCLSGKWGIAEPDTPGVPTRKGFDNFLGVLNQRHADRHFPEWIWKNEQKLELPTNRGGQLNDYAAARYAEHAIEFIHERGSDPFFLYLAFCIPHDDYDLPDLGQFANKPWTLKQKAYAKMVSDGDRYVGRVVEALRQAGVEENTLLFVCSDNGAALKDDTLFNSTGPYSGGKFSLLEGGLRVPMIVRWPGKVPADAVSDAPWHFSDFLPTAAALAGGDVPHAVTGMNVLPALLGESQPALQDRLLYWETTKNGFRRAARLGRWKAVQDPIEQPIRLYDLAVDVAETNDVSDVHPELVADLKQQMDGARVPSPFHFNPGESR